MLPQETLELAGRLAVEVVGEVKSRIKDSSVTVEEIQDLVEHELMRGQHTSVARRYILYRAEHTKIRRLRAEENLESDGAFSGRHGKP